MFLGALVDAGVPLSLLQQTVRSLNLCAEIVSSRVDRSGITATKIDVIVNGVKDMPREEYWAEHGDAHAHTGQGHEHTHTHDDGTTHSHAHPHEHTHTPMSANEVEHTHHHDHVHGHEHVHRGLKEIRAIIQSAPVSNAARTIALRAFQLLGEAEAKIHNKDLDSIHFHEVGSVDAIVDILCGAVAADWLKVDRWVCSPLNVGGGVVKCAHGTLPVPAPATLELLKDAPVYSSGIQKELVTPTGAAIVRALVGSFGDFPTTRISSTGYGAGARNIPGSANVLRVTVGESLEQELAEPHDTVTVIEANLDDMSPQVIGYAIDRLLQAGALDVFATPVQMKKSRPGVVLTVLTVPADAQPIAQIIFEETTTIGLRMRQEHRQTLAREHVPVVTPWGEVRIKTARLHGRITNFAPEYEDCRKLAQAHGISLKSVIQESTRIYLDQQPEAEKARLQSVTEHQNG